MAPGAHEAAASEACNSLSGIWASAWAAGPLSLGQVISGPENAARSQPLSSRVLELPPQHLQRIANEHSEAQQLQRG